MTNFLKRAQGKVSRTEDAQWRMFLHRPTLQKLRLVARTQEGGTKAAPCRDDFGSSCILHFLYSVKVYEVILALVCVEASPRALL